jgi:hypothetical protein
MIPTMALAASSGLAVIVANSYDGFLPAAPRDASTIAETLTQNGFTTLRRLDASGGEMAGAISEIRQEASAAGPTRFVYLSGFGMCLNNDLVLFAEDLQPEQFKTGQVADFAIPVSLVAGAAAADADQILVVFDAIPRLCTRDAVKTITLPENTVLLVTTGIGGDLVDELDEDGAGVFATAFSEVYTADRPLGDVVSDIVAKIDEITDGQQKPILVGEFSSKEEEEEK